MVSIPTPEESRAGSLTLIGGELAFDFTNTSSGRGWPAPTEHLRSAENVVAWARHAKVLGPADADWLRGAVAADEALARRLLRRALDLREALYAIGVEIAAGSPAPAPQVDRLAKEHAACVAHAKLTPDGGRYIWSWTPREAAVEAVLGPIALSALATLGQADLTRVKRCEGEKCGWLFFDTTKNKSRRWCEMEVCGNRAKQKRLGARMRGG
ncbi:CGNR zinc finger domain-containing protein [Methylocapsa sp. S129]|uniref:CGNR zinc finger domain-containing protein n=1 Tax=Methylocapsa sp. S129 TaxID=1641869 RepID=UPI00131E9358|nr:CGNR zinc finger domain-containing protein [Methylocapsa sp. S129]